MRKTTCHRRRQSTLDYLPWRAPGSKTLLTSLTQIFGTSKFLEPTYSRGLGINQGISPFREFLFYNFAFFKSFLSVRIKSNEICKTEVYFVLGVGLKVFENVYHNMQICFLLGFNSFSGICIWTQFLSIVYQFKVLHAVYFFVR